MPTVTFQGPLSAGPIDLTTANVVGFKRNVGGVVLVQSFEWEQADAVSTGIVIPAVSQILEIALYVGTTAPEDATINIGTTIGTTSAGGDELGAVVIDDTTNTTYRWSEANTTSSWFNVGIRDVEIFVGSSTGTSGRGILTVQYVQSPNLEVPVPEVPAP